MNDCFNLNDINESLLNIIGLYSQVNNYCINYILEPSEEKKNEIVEILLKLDDKQLKVKKNVVRMLNVMNDNNETIEAEASDKGFKLE